MNGLVVVKKAKNKTSRDVVNELNHIFSFKKIGHTGTLDPLASGVLVCLFGKYTKLVNLITGYDKEYIATMKLGIKTDTLDITGTVLDKKKVNITKDQVIEVFNNFPRTYEQTVPIYSAVKIKGKKLYEYARNNEEVILPTRVVNIYNLELLEYHNDLIKFKSLVSKGTYIRSLINDLAIKLNTYGVMQDLIRTKQGNFKIEDAYTLEDIKNNNYKLLNIKEFLDYPIIELDNKYYKQIINGVIIPNIFNIKDKVIFTYQNNDIAIYELNNQNLKPYLML